MERDFTKNKEYIYIVNDYLVGLELDLVAITTPDGTMSRKLLDGPIAIDDDRVIEAVQRLFENGYYIISKNADCILFRRWGIKDKGSGIAYSITGRTPSSSSLQFLTKIERMSEDRWYYFEEDFNELRRKNN